MARKKLPAETDKRSPAVPADREIVNADGAAEALGVSRRLVLRLAREGKLPGKKVGREWRFVRSDLRAWISGGGGLDSLEELIKSGKLKFGK